MNPTLQKVTEQRDRARAVIRYLGECGNDEVYALDLLDALASLGLRLEADGIGYSTAAYQDELEGKP